MKPGDTYPRIAVLGLGNLLLADDGVGVHAVRQLQNGPPEGVVVAEVGTAILHAQHLIEQADFVIAIDAVCAGGKPGSVYRFDAADADDTDQHISLHQLGIIGVLRLMPEGSRPKVTILGVEPEKVSYAMELSPTVQAVLNDVVEAAKEIVKEICQQGRTMPDSSHAASAPTRNTTKVRIRR